jgi:hypothetical protein
MLIELWEWLRGYDKWVETDAKIASADLQQIAHLGRSGGVSYTYDVSGDTLVWKDMSGRCHSAEFRVSDKSPLFHLAGGEKVTIRYNPARPGQYYYPELLRARFVAAGRKSVPVLGFLLVLLFLHFLRRH